MGTGMDMVTAIPASNHKPQGDPDLEAMKGFNKTTARSLAILLVLASESAFAAKWDFSESVMASVAYTDNVELVEDDTESAWALILAPNFLVNGQGRRLNVSIAGSLQFVSGSDETFYPQLRANANSELIKNRFFVNVFATANQQTINPLRPAGSPINRTDNLTTTYTVGFNPYYIEHFGDVADLRLDYNYRHQFYVSGDLNDRYNNDFHFGLNSGRRFSAFDWGLFGRYEKTTYQGDSASNTTFKSLDARLGYRLTRSLSPYFTFGKEWNTYQSSGTRSGGPKWLVGATWIPNPRLDMDFGYGYRFFGHYPYVSLSYRHRRSALRLLYTHDLESGYLPLDQQSILAQTDLKGNPVNPFAGNPLDLANPAPGNYAGNGANVNKHLTLSYILSGKRTKLGINGSYSDREYVEEFRNILEWRVGLDLSRQLARQLAVSGITRWYRTENESDFRADTWDLGFRITRGLGDHTNLTFSYTYSNRDSNRPGDDYTENRLALVLHTSMVKLAKHAGLL